MPARVNKWCAPNFQTEDRYCAWIAVRHDDIRPPCQARSSPHRHHDARPQNEEFRRLKAEHHVRRRISPGNERRLAARACQRPPTSASGGVIVEEFEPPLTSVVFPRQLGYGDPARSFHESTFLALLPRLFLMRAICNHTPKGGMLLLRHNTTFHPVWLPRPQALSPRWLSDCSNSRNEIETRIVELNH